MPHGQSLWALTPEGSTEAPVGLKMGRNRPGVMKDWEGFTLLKVVGRAQERRASLRPWAWEQGRLAQGELLEQKPAGGKGRAGLSFLLHRVRTVPQGEGMPQVFLSWWAEHLLCSHSAPALHEPGRFPDLYVQKKG